MCPCVSAEPEASDGSRCVFTLGEATQDGQGRALCDQPQISQLRFQVLAWRSLDPWPLLQPFSFPDGSPYSLCSGPISPPCHCSDLGPRIPSRLLRVACWSYPALAASPSSGPHAHVPGLHPPQFPAHVTPLPRTRLHGMCPPSVSLSALWSAT